MNLLFQISIIRNKLNHSKLFKDSFWAVFGNGTGNFLLLISGILIARLLGSELYGEYGLVKTTMFHVAAFSTMGLGYTSTKFVAENIASHKDSVRSIALGAINITTVFSSFLCVLLFLFSRELASFVNDPRLEIAFKYLGVIMIFKSVGTTASGILSGFKEFRVLGLSNIISGMTLFVLCIFLTYEYSVVGSLIALLISQFVYCSINLFRIFHLISDYRNSGAHCEKELLLFSFPIEMQELTYTLSTWGASLLIAKYSTIVEVGIWTAAYQWNAIIMFVPSLLSSVILSYLSSLVNDKDKHSRMVNNMLLANFICVLIPFLVVSLCSEYIVSFYGSTFVSMRLVLNVLVFSTLFVCMTNVYQAELISKGRNWMLFLFRAVRDIALVTALYFVLVNNASHAALSFSIINVVVYMLYFLVLFTCRRWIEK